MHEGQKKSLHGNWTMNFLHTNSVPTMPNLFTVDLHRLPSFQGQGQWEHKNKKHISRLEKFVWKLLLSEKGLEVCDNSSFKQEFEQLPTLSTSTRCQLCQTYLQWMCIVTSQFPETRAMGGEREKHISRMEKFVQTHGQQISK